jgi:hypothetical protein
MDGYESEDSQSAEGKPTEKEESFSEFSQGKKNQQVKVAVHINELERRKNFGDMKRLTKEI